MSWQIRCRIVVVAITLVLGVSVRAATDWFSAPALGTVAVSFDSKVQVFDNVGVIDDVTVTGPSGGLAFDSALNLLVANTVDDLVKLAPGTAHAASTIGHSARTESTFDCC